MYCHALSLVIEIDGEIHLDSENRKYDIGRTAELERFDIKVIRYTNTEVTNNLQEVVRDIVKECKIRKEELWT